MRPDDSEIIFVTPKGCCACALLRTVHKSSAVWLSAWWQQPAVVVAVASSGTSTGWTPCSCSCSPGNYPQCPPCPAAPAADQPASGPAAPDADPPASSPAAPTADQPASCLGGRPWSLAVAVRQGFLSLREIRTRQLYKLLFLIIAMGMLATIYFISRYCLLKVSERPSHFTDGICLSPSLVLQGVCVVNNYADTCLRSQQLCWHMSA